MAKRNARNSGSIRKKTITKNGQEYTYWESRVTVGTDPGTGKQIQKSFTGKTQKEVRERLQAATVEINNGTYKFPSKMTVGEWLDTWVETYLGGVKPFTVASYTTQIRNHIKPAFGAVKLEALKTEDIQKFYNGLGKETSKRKALSPKTIKNIHGVFHAALDKAVALKYIRYNPSDACDLPRIEQKQIQPLDEIETKAFLEAIKGHRFEELFRFTLFSGLREGEALGLKWDCVDFRSNTILVDKQLQREKKKDGKYIFAPLKNDKARRIVIADRVMKQLWAYKVKQFEMRSAAGAAWENSGLVFTDELGHHLAIHTVYKDFKKIVAAIGKPDARFHDLRHSYAVASIRAGDDIKTVQDNLGHATASFTLDIYGHVTEQMKQASAARMDSYMEAVLGL